MASLESCLRANKVDRHFTGIERIGDPYPLLIDRERLNKGVRGIHPKL